VVDLGEEFGEAIVRDLALASAEDARRRLAEGHLLRAAFSAAHHVQLTGDRPWPEEDQRRMCAALAEEARRLLASGDGATAARRASYLRMLGCGDPWSEDERSRLREAARPPQGLRAWAKAWFAGQAADWHLLSGETFWDRAQLEAMLAAVREDFALRLREGDKVMAADRLALYRVLAESLE
jgi:hypothetical protein